MMINKLVFNKNKINKCIIHYLLKMIIVIKNKNNKIIENTIVLCFFIYKHNKKIIKKK